jgi:hypothetical protein
MIYGYSERGIFNSIIYYLDSKQEEQPKLIGEFLELLGIKGFDNENHKFTFLNEQSFSDFGDSDLVIIAEHNQTKEKTVVFIEGKVKTYSQKEFTFKKQFDKIIENKQYKGISSNIFVQLYYKYLLAEKMDCKNFQAEKSSIGKTTKKLGKNQIVKRGYEKIAKAQMYYYVAIIPEQKGKKTMQNYFEDLALLTDVKDNIRCAFWQNIEAFFVEKNAKDIKENFKYNESQIY